jgi:2-polyprenyl-3-methyl-5-hydroxy-6-metoxy-1,4-benzoquinol methylase
MIMKHISAKPSHYNYGCEHYDAFNEDNSKIINQTIESILKKNNKKTVLDLTCGTGSQVFWLTQRGYNVTGVDINSKMLKIARKKAKHANRQIKFLRGDIRTTHVGQFDSIISIFNAIGHLTKQDFKKALVNIAANLKDGGLYIFDIYNLSYLLTGTNITDLTIDWLEKDSHKNIRTIQYSTIDNDGILASYTTSYVQTGYNKPKISKEAQTLQVYTKQQLLEMLQKTRFDNVKVCEINGAKFHETKSDRLLVTATKRRTKN